MEKAKGAREPGTDRGKRRPDRVSGRQTTLQEQGITEKQSKRWQRIAAVPPATFDAHIAEAKSNIAQGSRVRNPDSLR
jgi:hypothetical protein